MDAMFAYIALADKLLSCNYRAFLGRTPLLTHLSQMAVKLLKTYTVCREGHKDWQVKQKAIINCEEKAFVKLNPARPGNLSKLLFEHKGKQSVPKEFSLATTPGYLALRAMRNKAVSTKLSGAAALFHAASQGSGSDSKWKRRSRDEAKEVSLVTFNINGTTIHTIMPKHPKSDFMLHLDEDELNTIISYIASSGLESQKKKREKRLLGDQLDSQDGMGDLGDDSGIEAGDGDSQDGMGDLGDDSGIEADDGTDVPECGIDSGDCMSTAD